MGGPKQTVPKNWPEDVAYLTAPAYSPGLATTQLQAIRSKPSEMREMGRDAKAGPCALVKITPIADAQHPAHGQAGLFATRHLPAGSLILPYLGEVHAADAEAHASSDYDLWLDREAGVAIDGAKMGTEARFINDYRGVPGAARPNAEFGEVWDARRGEKAMAVFVLAANKKDKERGKAGGIAKGQEILVSYGKGFWEERQKEA